MQEVIPQNGKERASRLRLLAHSASFKKVPAIKGAPKKTRTAVISALAAEIRMPEKRMRRVPAESPVASRSATCFEIAVWMPEANSVKQTP